MTAGHGRRGGERVPAPDFRVLLAIASLLVLLAVAILVAVFLIVGLRDDTTRLTDNQVRYVRAVHLAALNAKGVANDERGFLLTGKRVFLNELAQRDRRARAEFEAASRTATSEGQSLAIEEARLGYGRWYRALRADIAAYQAGQRGRAVDSSLGPTRELRKDYERALDLAHVLGVSAVEAETSSVSTTSSRSVAFLLAYLVFALVVGGAVALWVVRAILRPAHALLRVVGDDARTAV